MTREEARTALSDRNNLLWGMSKEEKKYYSEALDMAISALAENKGDLISRQAVLDSLKEHRSLYCDNTPDTFSKLSYAEKSRVDELDTAIATIINLPSVENKGEWIYDKGIENWRCSKCGQTPPPTGYVGKTDFMEKHFKFCPNCGADMRGKT